jgi:hypothetical protein
VVIENGLVLLEPRQKESSSQGLATNLCYGVTVMDRNVSSDCLCSWRSNRVDSIARFHACVNTSAGDDRKWNERCTPLASS